MNQQMNPAVMNAAGGPVGGTPMMNNGAGPQFRPHARDEHKSKLDTYIYDYFLKNGHHDIADLVFNKLPVKTHAPGGSPQRREVNGISDGMDSDPKNPKNGVGKELPQPDIPNNSDSSFLLDWWCQFWDVWEAQRGKQPGTKVQNYLSHTQQQTRIKQENQQRMLGMIPGGANMANANMNANMQRNYQNLMQNMQNMGGMQNGMNMNDLQKRVMSRGGAMNPQQMQQFKQMQQQQQLMGQTQMQREGSGMDMGAQQRPQSPTNGDSAPSPKRQRLEGGGFNGQQMGPGGRGQVQGMQGAQQFNAFPNGPQNVQGKALEAMANAGGMPQGSPMSQQTAEAMMSNNSDYYAANPGGPGGMRGMPGPPTGGNHALQDYQMQLMLLEQQNKKRLMMARQEQDSLAHGPAGPVPGPGGQPAFPQSMSSPSGRTSGPSPNAGDMRKNETPKLGPTGLPSPLPDGMPARASPAPNFDPSQMPPNMQGQFYPPVGKMPDGSMMGPNGAMMRPPSSHPNFNGPMNAQMEMFARQQAATNGGRMPNGNWPGGPPMMPQNPGQQPPHMTPRQPNAMPPPPAPPTNQGGAGQAQPASPQQPAAPPTPSQTNKGKPTKKDAKDNKKKPQKKNSTTTGATPASEAEPPPTPTPSTPITPMNPASFANQKNGVAASAANPQQAQAPTAAPPVAQPQPDLQTATMMDVTQDDQLGNLDFGSLGGDGVLNFDFDSFLHNEPGGEFNFDPTLGFEDLGAIGAGDGEV